MKIKYIDYLPKDEISPFLKYQAMRLNIVIYEDNESLRKSLVAVLGSGNSYKIVGDYGDVLNVEQNIKEKKPDIVILDINLPELDGISAIPIIKKIKPDTLIVMYTQFEDENKLFSSLCAGANGYILKKTPPLKLFEAIKELENGGAPMSPLIARRVLKSFEKNQAQEEKYNLTKRETEVLELLIKGGSVKYIASELNIAFETCRSHLHNIYRKLHVRCGKEAIAKILSKKNYF